MPFDRCLREWEDKQPKTRRWYTVSSAGQRNKRKRWQVDTFYNGDWMPVISFYADTKREANGLASWAMHYAFLEDQ